MKIIGVGRNYIDHIKELQNDKPLEPILFMKPDSAIIAKQHPFVIPEFSNNIHHEIEVIVKINKVGKYIDTKFANKYYDQISIGIDFTARDLQDKLKLERLPWEKSKSFDGSAAVGNFVSKKQFETVDNIKFGLLKNNTTVQIGNTKDMLWKIDELISYISQYFSLKIGDIIFTGTPPGVTSVKSGDVLEGFLENEVLLKTNIK